MIKGQVVILAGFQRNGAAMISHSFAQLTGISHLGEIFATNTNKAIDLLHPSVKWKVPIYRKLFGMDRIPSCLKPTVRYVQEMAAPHHCNMMFDMVMSGEQMSELNQSLNIDDRVVFAKVAFEHCPYYYNTWEHILSNEKIKLIWVHRVNPLHMLISGANANKQEEYQVIKGGRPKTGTVGIELNYLYEYLAFYQAHVTFFSLFLRNRKNVLIIKYKDLVRAWSKKTDEICGFVGMKKEEVPLMLEKQITKHLELVENRKQIEEALKQTDWDWCLNE